MGSCPGPLDSKLQAQPIRAGFSCLGHAGGLRDIHSNPLPPRLSIKGRIHPLHFPTRDTSQLECEETASERSFSSVLYFIQVTGRKLYWSLSPNRIALWAHKHNMAHIHWEISLLQPPSFSSIISLACKVFPSLFKSLQPSSQIKILPLPIDCPDSPIWS